MLCILFTWIQFVQSFVILKFNFTRGKWEGTGSSVTAIALRRQEGKNGRRKRKKTGIEEKINK